MANLLAKNGKIIGGVPQDGYVEYSTSEKIIGTWIDGKPLYQKTIQAKAGAVTTDGTMVNKTTAHNIANIESRIGCYINGSAMLHLFGNANAIRYCDAYFDTTNVTIRTNSTTFSNATVYVTIQYTKTTD